jgi:hypothetical protein
MHEAVENSGTPAGGGRSGVSSSLRRGMARAVTAVLAVQVTGCATLPKTGVVQATGEPLEVVWEQQTHEYVEQVKVAEVQHRDSQGRSLGSSDVVENKLRTYTTQRWYPAQGKSPLDDEDFFRIAGDARAAQEVREYREVGVLYNRLGIGFVAAGGAVAIASLTLKNAPVIGKNPNVGLYSSLGLGLLGVWLYSKAIGRLNPENHPVDANRATTAAKAYNARLAVPTQEPQQSVAGDTP